MALPVSGSAQAPARPPILVPVGVELVQVDAVVTDQDGRYVTDLTAEDFEIVEDGKTRAIANFRYVDTGGAARASTPGAASAPVAPPAAAAAETRTLAVVIDDLSLGFEANVRMRAALGRLVDEQLAPGELVAIVRTGGGVGNLQQFTSDKRLLKAAIEGVPFNLAGRGALVSAVATGDPASATGAASVAQGGVAQAGGGDGAPPSDPGGAAIAAMQASLASLERRLERQRQVSVALGTLSALEAVVQALARMPGRKSLLFVSEGFVLVDARDDGLRVRARLRDVIESANRASVVIYGLDAAGLRTHGAGASEILRVRSDVEDFVPNAASQLRELQTGIVSLAEETGGLALVNTNDLDGAVGRAFLDQRGYYLLGFEPAAGSADRRGRHQVALKVKRPGLRVRSRRTFYARTDAPAPEDTKLITTLVSPFAATDVPVRLTALFHHDPPKGSFVRTLLHIDAHQLTFETGPDGALTTRLEAAALCFGANGRLAGQAGGTYPLRVKPEAAAQARASGLVLTLDIPLKPGAYQVRSAVRDLASGRAGSAFQFVEVPDVAKGGIALSGIVMSGTDGPATKTTAAVDPAATPAVRRFAPGERVAYAFAIYNAGRTRAAGAPGLDVRVGLARDGVALAAVPGPAVTVPEAGGPVPVAGALRLAPQLAPGTYTLQVLVSDPSRPASDRDAAQQIDFEIAAPAGS
ncbi:MAG: VWA domain-containing protein [Vicinamibacteria bacterium]